MVELDLILPKTVIKEERLRTTTPIDKNSYLKEITIEKFLLGVNYILPVRGVLTTVRKIVNLLMKGNEGDILKSLIEKHGMDTLQ